MPYPCSTFLPRPRSGRFTSTRRNAAILIKSFIRSAAQLKAIVREAGSDQVSTAIADGVAIGAVNLSEVVAKLTEAGMPEPVIHQALDPLGLDVHSCDERLAYEAGSLRAATKQLGLSLGDRCCVALARALNLPLLTSDRAWGNLDIGVAALPLGATVEIDVVVQG